MNDKLILQAHIDKLHTTEMGSGRIKKNLRLDTDDIIKYCQEKIRNENCRVYRKGKNWYCEVEEVRITVNSSSYTVITAHFIKR